MEPDTYPPGAVRALLNTDRVTEATREALKKRLEPPDLTARPRFFDETQFAILRAVCARLLPADPNGPEAWQFAFCVDERLVENKGNGWRYDALPGDGAAYQQALASFDETAQSRFGANFVGLDDVQQDEVLRAVQTGAAEGETWQTLPAARFFEEMLAELVEAYYSHPLAQETIGYAGMADAKGWKKIGLNVVEDWEVRAALTPRLPLPILGEGVPGTGSGTSSRESPFLSVSPSPRIGRGSRGVRAATASDPVDAVIIGTGAGGAPLLARLAQAGLKVVALEAGKRWDPARDFATDEMAQEKLFWSDERLSAGGDPVAFGNNNSGIGVGGSTLHYTAYTPRVQPDDLRLFSEFGVGCDWPLSYEDLEPYYDELEAFLGVSGPTPYPWGPKRKQGYPLLPLPLNGAAQLMARACARMGIRTSPAANAALSAPYFQPGVGWRAACTNRGFCQAGCSTGAKASMDVTFLPLAERFGAEIRAECFVTRIETDRAGRVNGVVYVNADGNEERQACRAVFLCAGAVETPRLLLLNHLANASGQVGRNFMAHTGVQVWGQFDDDVRPFKGIPGGLISEDTHRPKDADFAGGYLLQSIGVMPVTYASQMARGRGLWGDTLGAHMKGYNHVAGINILGDCLPYESNFLELSHEKDARGLFKPRIHFTNGENEKRLTTHAERLMGEIWKTAGARDLWTFPRNAHVIGTCRMGTDPAASVVSPDGAVWDVPGLYVCDNSIFPSALSANPALTIMALSLRTADRFLENKNG